MYTVYLYVVICTLWFQFFGEVIASKRYPFKNIFYCITFVYGVFLTKYSNKFCKFGIKSSRIGEITLSFTYIGKACPCREFQRRKYVFYYDFHENKNSRENSRIYSSGDPEVEEINGFIVQIVVFLLQFNAPIVIQLLETSLKLKSKST